MQKILYITEYEKSLKHIVNELCWIRISLSLFRLVSVWLISQSNINHWCRISSLKVLRIEFLDMSMELKCLGKVCRMDRGEFLVHFRDHSMCSLALVWAFSSCWREITSLWWTKQRQQVFKNYLKNSTSIELYSTLSLWTYILKKSQSVP